MNKVNTSCIIDDDPIFVYGTKRIMKEIDFCNTILEYSNGQDAIEGLTELLKDGKELPKVIFLDLNMPIMNGWEFLEDFVNIPHPFKDQVIIYILSSSVDPRDLTRIRHYESVSNYILKPISSKDLKNVLDKIS